MIIKELVPRIPSPTMNHSNMPQSPPPRKRHIRSLKNSLSMTGLCFVCNLPILSHQVCLEWTGGNGWDEQTRAELEEITLRQRLGSHRDSWAQAIRQTPPDEEKPERKKGSRRRRSSLAHLTDVLREWTFGNSKRKAASTEQRRETLSDLECSPRWNRIDHSSRSPRRDSTADTKIKSFQSKRHFSFFINYLNRSHNSREKEKKREDSGEYLDCSVEAVLERYRRASEAAEARAAIYRKNTTSHPTVTFADAASEATGPCPAPATKVKVLIHRDADAMASTSEMPTIITSVVTPSPTSPTPEVLKPAQFSMEGTGAIRKTTNVSGHRDSKIEGTGVIKKKTHVGCRRDSTMEGTGAIRKTTSVSGRRDSRFEGTGAIRKTKIASGHRDSIEQGTGVSQRTTNVIGCEDSMMEGTDAIRKTTNIIERRDSVMEGTGAIRKTTNVIDRGDSTMEGTGSIRKTTNVIDRGDSTMEETGAIRETTNVIDRGYSTMEETGAIQETTNVIDRGDSPMEGTGAIRKTTNVSGRRDSTTQCGKTRRNSKAGISPERRLAKLQSQGYDDSLGSETRRRDSGGSTLGPDDDVKIRRDSLSPDSAVRPRRERSRFSPDRAGESERSPAAVKRKVRLRRQATYARARRPGSPDTSSCSSREHSPCRRPERTVFRRQSTTEEILIARGFRRQSTTEEMLRCRNFRRQSAQSYDAYLRSRGRRDSSTQITDGTVATMSITTTTTFFDSGTQTDPTPQFDNSHYHEECLRCNTCGMNLTGLNQARARRYKNQILCDLHFADVALMQSNDFMQQLRSFRTHTLGCVQAADRRKSSNTYIFPLPPQACSDEFCEEYPHGFVVTPGYWIECSRQKINASAIWEDYESEQDGTWDPDLGDTDRYFISLDETEESNEGPSTSTDIIKKKTPIEEQWERNGGFELTSVEQESYERYFCPYDHWNYYSNDVEMGPIVMSLKQETFNKRDQFRILLRAVTHTVHGLIPAACVFADRYNREEVVASLGKEINIIPPLKLGELSETQDELIKLDQVFIKSELKVGVIYVKENQVTEQEILDNNENSPAFDEFLELLGERVRLKGFDRYKGGLDTVNDLTGLFSIYTHWRGIEVMFHISTLLPYEQHDEQKLQRKRHIGNDIVCVVFMEADNTTFSPVCIKSHFLHTFILVRVSPTVKQEPTCYEIAIVTRDEVGAYKPYLWEQSIFNNGPMFREWLLTKIVNAERASYSAPKFARMQERTRSQMLSDIVANLQNHADTGQKPKPYRRGSWRPIGYMRATSPLLDSVTQPFEDHDQLARDFSKAFVCNDPSRNKYAHLFDITFLVGQSKEKKKIRAVRAILGIRSRVFQEMLYGGTTGFGSSQGLAQDLLSKPASTASTPKRLKDSNFLQVPASEPRSNFFPSSPMVKRAFSRLGTITAGWGRSIRKQASQATSSDKKKWTSSQDCSNKESKQKKKGKNKGGPASVTQRLSICADVLKVDKAKLAQTEFPIIEFDPESFGILMDYLHTGTCTLSCAIIPGLISEAEHFDLPELLQACFHHVKQHLRIKVVTSMLNKLESYYWRYTAASELVNMILVFVEQRAYELFQAPDFVILSESMLQMIMCRNLEVPEIIKFDAMIDWAKYKVEFDTPDHLDKDHEYQCIMARLTRDLKLNKLSPQEILNLVLPEKVIKSEKILETLTNQAKSSVEANNKTDENGQNHVQGLKKEDRHSMMGSVELCI